jgi:hypothetical protein
MNKILKKTQKTKSIISFKIKGRSEISTGFVLDFNSEVIHLKSNPVDYIIDGYKILNREFIEAYKIDDDEEFKTNAFRLKKIFPKASEKIKLIPFDKLLFYLNKFEVFQFDQKDDSICFIGKVQKIKNKTMTFKLLDARAKWSDSSNFRYDTIRTIEYGTDYINTLLLINKSK